MSSIIIETMFGDPDLRALALGWLDDEQLAAEVAAMHVSTTTK
jgi:hypothetical protein